MRLGNKTRRFKHLTRRERAIAINLVEMELNSFHNPQFQILAVAEREDGLYIYVSVPHAAGRTMARELRISPWRVVQMIDEMQRKEGSFRGAVFGIRYRTKSTKRTNSCVLSGPLAYFLAYFIPREHREEWLGDLEEQYAELYERAGQRYARAWFFIQVVWSVGRFAWEGLKGWVKKEIEKRLESVLGRLRSS